MRSAPARPASHRQGRCREERGGCRGEPRPRSSSWKAVRRRSLANGCRPVRRARSRGWGRRQLARAGEQRRTREARCPPGRSRTTPVPWSPGARGWRGSVHHCPRRARPSPWRSFAPWRARERPSAGGGGGTTPWGRYAPRWRRGRWRRGLCQPCPHRSADTPHWPGPIGLANVPPGCRAGGLLRRVMFDFRALRRLHPN